MNPLRRLASVLVAVSVSSMVPVAANGQDAPPAEKPCEERLRDSQEQLRRAENRVKDLIKENERLRRDISEARAGGKTPPKPKASESPSGPLASPGALYEALVKDYQAKVGSLPRESQPEKIRYQGAAKKWASDSVSAFRGPVEWQIRVVKVGGSPGVQAGKPADVTFNILDAGGKPIGEPFTQAIPGRFMRDLSDGIGSRVFKLTGTFGAHPKFDPSAGDRTADRSSVIGPFVLFDCDLAVLNIVEAK